MTTAIQKISDLHAEIESLRKEVRRLKAAHDHQYGVAGTMLRQAERYGQALELIATPMRPDGTWNRDREACRQLAAEALGKP